MSSTSIELTAELQRIRGAIGARQARLTEKIKQRGALVARIYAGGDVQDDVELAAINAEIAGLRGAVEALEARAQALEQEIVAEQRRERARATEHARAALVKRCQDHVELARQVDAAADVLLGLFQRYATAAAELRNDTGALLKGLGLRAPEMLEALDAVGAAAAAAPGGLLVRALVRSAPGGKLGDLVAVSSGLYDRPAVSFESYAQRDADRAKHFIMSVDVEPANG